ncbi:uncharacterized protein PpBr36_09480 [Pyricularia pennisetigena]|uniref:uncharacterized protein n=1 Tax=Pyricularia pennisetigena TaxID=1578925 RepID=UPI00114E4399|nr:uncharacterized protein PpBr36_09480 [Pyricularia pennisetigena]TLS22025.1 hypothetical protein PpBr36_09480 [Pyricularia pennisetigena]
MKFSIILAAAASAVVAQDLSTLPNCAVECLSSAIASSGCKGTDIACQCGEKKTAIANAATPCLLAQCTDPNDLAKAATNGEALCKNVSSAVPSATPSSAAPTATPTGNSSAPASTTKPATTTGVPKTNGTSSVSPTSSASGTGANRTPSSTTGGSPAATSPAGSGAAAVTIGAGALLALFGAVIAL